MRRYETITFVIKVGFLGHQQSTDAVWFLFAYSLLKWGLGAPNDRIETVGAQMLCLLKLCRLFERPLNNCITTVQVDDPHGFLTGSARCYLVAITVQSSRYVHAMWAVYLRFQRWKKRKGIMTPRMDFARQNALLGSGFRPARVSCYLVLFAWDLSPLSHRYWWNILGQTSG